MPEAAVDKYADLMRWKDYVSCTTEPDYGITVLKETQAGSMYSRTE